MPKKNEEREIQEFDDKASTVENLYQHIVQSAIIEKSIQNVCRSPFWSTPFEASFVAGNIFDDFRVKLTNPNDCTMNIAKRFGFDFDATESDDSNPLEFFCSQTSHMEKEENLK